MTALNNLDPRRAAKTGQKKDNIEEDGRERKGKSWMEELEWGTNCGC